MSPSEKIPDDITGGVRVLNIRALVLHNYHVRGGYKRSGKCSWCKGGVDTVITNIEAEKIEPEADLDESSRTDKAGDAPPTSDSWDDWRQTR